MLQDLPKPLSAYTHLFFDLGGVLYQIDPARFQHNVAELAQQCGKTLDERDWGYFTNLAERFEVGLTSPEGFSNQLRKQFFPGAAPQQGLDIWNSLLVGFYPGVEDWLRRLARKHKVYLLSNTNPIHFNQIFNESDTFFECFHKVFLSFEMGSRKPDANTYRTALRLAEARPSDTLFFDDSAANIEGAKKVGIHSVLVTNPTALAELAAA